MDNANVPAHLEVVHPVVSREAVDPNEDATIPAVMVEFAKLQADAKVILDLLQQIAEQYVGLVGRVEKLEGLPRGWSGPSEAVSVDVVDAEPEPAQEAPPVARGTHSDGYKAYVDGLNRGE